MKDPKNIKLLNKLSISYMSLKGLQGVALEQDNPFVNYYMSFILMGSLFSINPDNTMIVPTSLFHEMIKKAYDFYKNIDNVEEQVNPDIKEQLSIFLESSDRLDNWIKVSISDYKNLLFELLGNYNSPKEDYIEIKKSVFEDKMFEYAKEEEYEKAAEIRDKIKNI